MSQNLKSLVSRAEGLIRIAFDLLYEEGAAAPKVLSLGLHQRMIGHPGRFRNLQRFVEYVLGHDHVWVATRKQIAERWIEKYPYAVATAG